VPYNFQRLILLDDIRAPAEARRIADLIADNVTVVCCKAMPEDWAVFDDDQDSADPSPLRARFQAAVDRGRVIDARAGSWKAALSAAQSVKWLPADATLSYQHRRVDGGEVYFLMNWGGDFDGEVSFPHEDLVPEFWDAETGATNPVGQYRSDHGRIHVQASLHHLESMFVVFGEGKKPLHAVACSDGRVEAEADGKLYVIPDENGPCRVELSDGTQLTLEASVPSSATLSGAWTLRAATEDGVGLRTAAEIELDRLPSWRDIPALRRFAGRATYTTQFTLADEHLEKDAQLWLELGRVHEVAKIWVNDRLVGTTWHSPHRLEITNHVRSGTNELRVEVANILKNHLEHGSGYTRPSGLLGPVQIRLLSRIELSRHRRAA
jgi:hypothetical protein